MTLGVRKVHELLHIYNRSKSGWFDSETFIDWFEKIIVPFFHGKEGKKCMIGEYLA